MVAIIPDEQTWAAADVVSSSTGPFNFSFKYFEKADLEVSIDGVVLAQSGFTVVPGPAATYSGFVGGVVTLVSAVTNVRVVVARKTITQRLANLTGSQLTANAINVDLSKLAMMLAEQRRDLERSILALYGSAGSVFDAADVAALSAIATEIVQVADVDTELIAVAARITELVAIYSNLSALITVSTALDDGTISDLLDGQIGKVASLSALQALTPVDGQVQYMAGHTTPGDGGEGLLRWVAASTTTKDDVTIFEDADGGTGRWFRVLPDGVIKPEMGGFFAGTSYTSVNLQTLLTLSGSYQLEFGAGIYTFDYGAAASHVTVTPPAISRVRGAGPGATTIKMIGTGATPTRAACLTLSNDDLDWRDMLCECTILAGDFPMFLLGGSDLLFDNCRFTTGHTYFVVGAYGFRVPDTGDFVNVTWVNCEFYGCRYAFLRGNSSTCTARRYKIIGCRFYNNVGGNLTFNSPSGLTEHVHISDCEFGDMLGGDLGNLSSHPSWAGSDSALVQGTEAIMLALGSTRHAVVINCVFAGTAKECIHLEESNEDVVISNCTGRIVHNPYNSDHFETGITFAGNNVGSGGTATDLYRMPEHIQISNCTFELVDLVDLDNDATLTMPNGGTVASLYDDDELTTTATTTGISTTNPYEIWHCDLGAAEDVLFVKVENLSLNSGSSREVFLQYSTDNVTWVTFGPASGQRLPVGTAPKTFVRMADVNARYWRLARVGATDLTTSLFSIGQVEIQLKGAYWGVGSPYLDGSSYGVYTEPNALGVSLSNVRCVGFNNGFQRGSAQMALHNITAELCAIGVEAKTLRVEDRINAIECNYPVRNYLPTMIKSLSMIDCTNSPKPHTDSTNNRLMVRDLAWLAREFDLPTGGNTDVPWLERSSNGRYRGGGNDLNIQLMTEASSNIASKHKVVTRSFTWDGASMTDTAVDNAGSGAFSLVGVVNNTVDGRFDIRLSNTSGIDFVDYRMAVHFAGAITFDE